MGLDFAQCYIDDIIVYSNTIEEHQRHLQVVFECLRAHGLKLHPGKCRFFHDQIEYLGHTIYPGGLGVQQAKVEAIARIPRPIDVSRVRAFMGLANFYRRYVKGFSAIAKPLTKLTKVDQEWQWEDEQERAFQELKDRLSSAPILRRPIRGRPFQLHTDWSMLGLGAVLTQMDDEGREFVVAYASRSNNTTEAKYSSYEGECLAVVWAVAHFRCYLFGNPFTIITDQQPLKCLMESDKLTGKLARWELILQEYDFDVVHRLGTANLDADGLSRNPSTSQQDATGARWHDEVDEEMVPGWHASAFLSILVPHTDIEGYSATPRSVASDVDPTNLEISDEVTSRRDIHDDALVLEYLRIGGISSTIGTKERDRILQRAKRFRWEKGLVLRVWEEGQVCVIPHPS